MGPDSELPFDLFAELGFVIVQGRRAQVEAGTGYLVFRRDDLVIRVAYDRLQLLFEVGSRSAPTEWYMFDSMRAVVHGWPVKDRPEPDLEAVGAFLKSHLHELYRLTAVANWPDFRTRLRAYEEELNAFMVKKLQGR